MSGPVAGHAGAGVYVDVRGPFCHQRPDGRSWSRLPPGTMLKSKDYAELALPLMGCDTWRAGPVPCLGGTVELAPVAGWG